MEVTMFHPDNKEGKVVVTNQIQYDAFKARGFVDAKEKDSKEAAETPGLQAKPTADASKDEPKAKTVSLTSDVDKKNAKETK